MDGFDTATVTAQGSTTDRHDGREVGTFTGHTWGLLVATSGDFHMATDTGRRGRRPVQKDVLDRQTWATREELRIAMETWIERIDDGRRRQVSLERLSPIEYETTITARTTQAA